MTVQYAIEDFADRIREFYRDPIEPIAESFMYRRPPTIGELRRPPQVLLLGNHSSGKSTFINYLLGEEIQKTGVAPTDDSFTIITWGSERVDRDGPSVVSNPDLPYENLRHFGDQLVSHVRMKQRDRDLLRTVTLIDSPGMIDEAKSEGGRGYDYPGAVRWFAERADLVIVFFDPDKPGTTGETLRVFKDSLSGIDHKLLIVMNKMDQFRNLHDFARAYGALCWNLGKVIPRKDLPMIYNTYTPIAGAPVSSLPTSDFDEAREQLLDELQRAPTRRLDNLITQMQTFAERLRLHTYVIDRAVREHAALRLRWRVGLFVLLAALAGGAFASGFMALIPAAVAVYAALMIMAENLVLPRASKRIVDRFEDLFEKIHEKDLLRRDQDSDLRALWAQVEPHAREVVRKRGLSNFPKLSRLDRDKLNELIEEEIPKLRSDLYGIFSRTPNSPDQGLEYANRSAVRLDGSLPFSAPNEISPPLMPHRHVA